MSVRITLYSKPECHLCDHAKAILGRLSTEYDLIVDVIDITTDQRLWDRYRDVIPVVALEGGPTFVSRISEYRLRRALEGMGGWSGDL